MSRIIKTVALDEQSASIAKELPNFSHFVRECLYRHAIRNDLECPRPKTFRGTDRCNPLMQPVCFSCWPNGSPGPDAVKQFSADGLSINFLDLKAKERNSHMIDLNGINRRVVKESPEKPPSVGFFASIRQKIRNRGD